MLQIKDIQKEYITGDLKQIALDGVSLNLRDNEFVAILGPSGSGKTTLLNIIGGLDRYDSGDLIIDGISTKKYRDRDWDSYRNHTIGFVFQSYNLIPHQSILSNVELALTISGISKSERKKRAKAALAEVGLAGQEHKRPNQMSGGQMQRVAIARALVNNPAVLLADEPTGALDTETSVQVMDLLKEVAKDRLVIMVTHNPELADTYATRIVKLRDGRITSDSDPYTPEASELAEPEHKRMGKASMNFPTALSLSLNNLLTKKARTMLTSFAGSIGIIGIALILSLSSGMQAYIQSIQEDTLSTYPIQIQNETVDITGMMEAMMGQNITDREGRDSDKVYSNNIMGDMMKTVSAQMSKNDLQHFKEFLDSDAGKTIRDLSNSVEYGYGVELQIYRLMTDQPVDEPEASHAAASTAPAGETAAAAGNTTTAPVSTTKATTTAAASTTTAAESTSGPTADADSSDAAAVDYIQVNPSSVINGIRRNSGMMNGSLLGGNTGVNLFAQMLANPELISRQYDVLAGRWPESKEELVIVVDKNNELSDVALYSLGILDQNKLTEMMEKVQAGEAVGESQINDFCYDDLMALRFRLLPNSALYTKEGNVWVNKSDSPSFMLPLLEEGLELKVVGVVRPDSDSAAASISGTVGYLPALQAWVIEQTNNSELAKAQRETPDTNILTGIPFDTASFTKDMKLADVQEWIPKLPEEKQAALLTMVEETKSTTQVTRTVTPAKPKTEAEILAEIKAQIRNSPDIQVPFGMDLDSIFENLTMDDIKAYIAQMPADQQAAMNKALQEAQTGTPSTSTETKTEIPGKRTEAEVVTAFKETVDALNNGQDYDKNLSSFGAVDTDKPNSINIYPRDFESKDLISAEIDSYNARQSADGHEEYSISYNDLIAVMMQGITRIINIITYVLVAFVAISLVVSSIMIGIITYISVLERTKEIGILRSIGASKKDVSRVFNAETVIEGLVAGAMGVGITMLLNIPVNIIIENLSDIEGISHLPAAGALGLIVLSVILTVIAGLLPSRVAAKKDPVEALRTE
ncbi:MAG: ABC transporter ATP-binding protein/permease [Oscillospiraceae bacterium]|jgi:putative ABC transport system permease protein|nr:ABC transporter ATP-binding protein/permease [Oscillospiraceae bacterium]